MCKVCCLHTKGACQVRRANTAQGTKPDDVEAGMCRVPSPDGHVPMFSSPAFPIVPTGRALHGNDCEHGLQSCGTALMIVHVTLTPVSS